KIHGCQELAVCWICLKRCSLDFSEADSILGNLKSIICLHAVTNDWLIYSRSKARVTYQVTSLSAHQKYFPSLWRVTCQSVLFQALSEAYIKSVGLQANGEKKEYMVSSLRASSQERLGHKVNIGVFPHPQTGDPLCEVGRNLGIG
uniref:Uncharacterized protein n=1 Tax=Megaselia scalaris TaxID=36166 RepID=T1GYG4_MEGSC